MRQVRMMVEQLQSAYEAGTPIAETARAWNLVTGVDIAAVDAEIRQKVADRQNRVGLHGKITRTRGVQGGRAVLAGTRIPVQDLKHLIETGCGYQWIMDQYPGVSELDLDAVVNFDLMPRDVIAYR